MKDSGITKFEDLFTKQLTVGGTGTSADTDQFPRVLNNVLGTHSRSSKAIRAAMMSCWRWSAAK